MDGEVKSNKFLISQPARVHSYSKLSKSESPRTHTSPTSILRKFPQSLRHDQKHQTKIKRNSSPVAMVIFGEAMKNGKKLDRNVKSWCLGDGSGADCAETAGSVTAPPGTGCSSPAEKHLCDCSTAGSLIGPEAKAASNGNAIRPLRESPSDSANGKWNRIKSVHISNNNRENASASKKDVPPPFSQAEKGNLSRELPEQQPNDKLKIGSLKKLSVINNSLNEFKNFNEKFWCNSADKISDFDGKILSPPVHKSTPNLLRSEPFSVSGSVSQPECVSNRLGRLEYFDGKKAPTRDLNQNNARHFRNQVPLKGSDSLPQLNYKYRIIHSILPKMNRASCGSHESLGGNRRSITKGCVRTDPRVGSSVLFNGVGRTDSYRLLGNSNPDEFGDLCAMRAKPAKLNCKSDVIRLEDESERISLISGQPAIVVQPRSIENEFEKCASVKEAAEAMPAARSSVDQEQGSGCSGRNGGGGARVLPPGISCAAATTNAAGSGSCPAPNTPAIREQEDDGGDGGGGGDDDDDDDDDDESLVFKKCDAIYALTDLFRTDSSLQIEPMKAINRLRVPPNPFGSSASRMCSRCSSLLSMASSSRYSLNTTGSGFIPCSPSEKEPEPIMLCKLCLLEVPLSQSIDINHCGCTFCRDCMRLYVEFEIQEGAYDISCPDAQCRKQGIISVDEVESLVATQMMERYLRFRLNHEVDLDRNRTWCPRAGCETVCNICPREKCSPTSVHCPTCDSDFCSNCKNPWHCGLTCEENSRKLAKEGRSDFMEPGIPFDSELIKSCPMCSVPIEKDEGCAQMMCKRCKHVFCWYCLASLDDDFLLRHYDKGPCKNKLGHSRASVIWHRTQVIGIFAGFGILLLVASPLLLVAAPCIVCCKCRVCSGTKMDPDEDLPEESGT